MSTNKRSPKVIPKKETKEALSWMYDAFIRDKMFSEFSHQKRMQVHEAYRLLEELVEEGGR